MSLVGQVGALRDALIGGNLNTTRFQVAIERERPIRMSDADIVSETLVRVVTRGAVCVVTRAGWCSGIAGYRVRDTNYRAIRACQHMRIALAFFGNLLPIQSEAQQAVVRRNETGTAVAGIGVEVSASLNQVSRPAKRHFPV